MPINKLKGKVALNRQQNIKAFTLRYMSFLVVPPADSKVRMMHRRIRKYDRLSSLTNVSHTHILCL